MYNAIVLPHFDYADTVYDAASETNKSRLQRLQTWAAGLISVLEIAETQCSKSLNGYHLKIGDLFINVLWFFKCRNGLAPPYLIDSFNANNVNTATVQTILLNSEYP